VQHAHDGDSRRDSSVSGRAVALDGNEFLADYFTWLDVLALSIVHAKRRG